MGQLAVISRLFGAAFRAFLVVLVIAMPSLLLPGTNSDTAQIIALICLFGATITMIEYTSSYPGLVEFRDAPPFNRIRFASLFFTVLVISMLCRGVTNPTTLTYLVEGVGALVGHVIDFPYSPVRLFVLMLPPDTSIEHITLVRSAAGLAYLTSLLTLAAFLVILRVKGWPNRTMQFNVWINLPTFDPTAGGDVVERLERDARFNIALGFLLPFLMPAVLTAASSVFGTVSLASPQTLIWTVTAWAFLPASVFMRGIAMGRIASMIEDKRRETTGEAPTDGELAPA